MFIEYRQKINYAYSYKKNLHTHTQTQKNFIHKKIFIHTYSNKQKKTHTQHTRQKQSKNNSYPHIYYTKKRELTHAFKQKNLALNPPSQKIKRVCIHIHTLINQK